MRSTALLLTSAALSCSAAAGSSSSAFVRTPQPPPSFAPRGGIAPFVVVGTPRPASPSFAAELRMAGDADADAGGSDDREDGWYPGQNLINVDQERIAFDELYMGSSDELVMFLPNLKLGRDCNQADSVLKHCIRRGCNYLCADYFARGDSTGAVMDATLSRWTADAVVMLDCAAAHVRGGRKGKAVLVGHAMGAWVAVLLALRRPELVRGIVGVGADPDFTEDLLWKMLPESDKDAIMRDGYREISWGKLGETYPITSSLIEDGRANLILRGGRDSLGIDCPVRLIHDLEDGEVPPETSMRLAECIRSRDVVVRMPKSGASGVNEAVDECFEATS